MMRNDRTMRLLLGVIAMLLAGNLVVQMSQAGGARRAEAQQVSAPAGVSGVNERLYNGIIDQLTQLNAKADKMESLLESGKLTVKVDAAAGKDK